MPNKILITGIPGTGKTTIGDELSIKLNYEHINLESNYLVPLLADPKKFIDEVHANSRDTVLTWGFIPNEEQISIVQQFKAKGFYIVWFDGNRDAARQAFNVRGTVPEELFNLQIDRIDNSDVIAKITPIQYNTFDATGEFKNTDTIINEVKALIAERV